MFRLMVGIYKIADLWYSPEKRIKSFGIKRGATVVDYGCGPGRYLRGFSAQVGEEGKVYGVDIHELALEYSKKRIKKYDLKNIELSLVHEHQCDIGYREVDYICALDMLHMVQDVQRLFKELHRIIKPGGTLILDDGHQKRKITKAQITESRLWSISFENKDHLMCAPK
jgi:ubiquinone/menaquinone biosynthesis C-methylase UbiE